MKRDIKKAIANAKDALRTVHLMKFADELSALEPSTPEEAARLAHYAETLRETFDTWTSNPCVKRIVTTRDALATRITLDSLALDCRDLAAQGGSK
jgi:hypothetical protein